MWRGEVASQAGRTLEKEQQQEMGRRKWSLCFTQDGGNTFPAAMQPLGCSSQKLWGRGLAQEAFLVSLQSRKSWGNQQEAAAPKELLLLLSALLGRFPSAASTMGCGLLEEWDSHKFMDRLAVKLTVLG